VLEEKLAGIGALEREFAREQLLINDGETVLIAMRADVSEEDLRRRVERGNRSQLWRRRRSQVLRAQAVYQPEVADFDMIANQEEIARLDVKMLQVVIEIHQVERFGDFAHVSEESLARDPQVPVGPLFLQQVMQIPIRQFHYDYQLALHPFDALHREQEGMAYRLDTLDGVQFFFGGHRAGIERVGIAVDKLDGFEKAARSFALPYFAETTPAQRLEQAVSGDGF
jgi:hypothetical protein